MNKVYVITNLVLCYNLRVQKKIDFPHPSIRPSVPSSFFLISQFPSYHPFSSFRHPFFYPFLYFDPYSMSHIRLPFLLAVLNEKSTKYHN